MDLTGLATGGRPDFDEIGVKPAAPSGATPIIHEARRAVQPRGVEPGLARQVPYGVEPGLARQVPCGVEPGLARHVPPWRAALRPRWDAAI